MIRKVFLGLVGFSFAPGAHALEICEPVVGELASLEGEVEVQRAATPGWQPAAMGDQLCEGDAVRAGRRSRAAISLINEAVLRLDQNTTLQLVDITAAEEERSFLELVVGAIQSFSRSPRLLAVNTPYLNATVEGTEFFVEVAGNESSVIVFEGVVAATNPEGEIRLASGEGAVAAAGEAPQPRIVVRPRDAVQWALYYPPIFAALGGRGMTAPPDLPPPLAEAADLANQGNVNGALEVLDRVPEAERDAQYHTFRAALLLSVGGVDDARAAIDRALEVDPDAGPAYAQRAIIELVQNEREQALADAERAVELSPEASAPKIALSYAHQGNFQLDAARATLLQATEQNPNDPLAWARLAEVWMMFGYLDRAREAAERAAALAPDLERTQIVLGFANLVEIRTAQAKAAFERAIELDPADPLPRLGLGLAQIRESSLEAGRGNLEVAVGLDSNDALLRAYLGKAYFTEKRDPLAADQYAIAKELDPLDPTAFLYDAILKQTQGRPGEALEDIQRSIELNDNRAVFRSRLLLDSDRAARGTSLALIYDDLGFLQPGINEASRSLTVDPANAGAHRFLSDIYVGVRRREIARVSNLLQAQMLQDININPVQPSLSEANLNLVTQGGPAQAGFNEFTPLFERNQAQLNAAGVVGNNNTYGGEGVASAVYDRFSVSAGGFGYTTDGWRKNNDIDQNVQNVFFQTAITPELNAQIEFRRRHSDFGDLPFNFDPDFFSENLKREIDLDTYRAGVRYSPLPSSDFLLSIIYSDLQEKTNEREDDVFDFKFPLHDEGYQLEGQHIYRRDRLNVTTGVAYYDVNRKIERDLTEGGVPILDQDSKQQITQPKAYVYGNLNFPDPVTWTVGVSYDDYHQDDLEVQKVNPKFGVQWNITDDLVLRGAVFRTVKPALVSNQTLEPTQVAGFNQLFDDTNAAAGWRYAVGVDHRLADNLFIGGEATWRELSDNTLDFYAKDAQFENTDEETHRAYVHWLPIPELALSLEVVYDKFTAEKGKFLTDLFGVPEKLVTYSVPLGARYFHPSGFFVGAGVAYINQDVNRADFAGPEGNDDFFYLDASIGYRLPKRFGIVSFSVTNLLDQDFHYQDDSFREFQDQPSIGPYFPERLFFGRITLNW
ncbi:MAG: TonB-dependent receptor domain-containing protein [Geminicoccaceae bacterium]